MPPLGDHRPWIRAPSGGRLVQFSELARGQVVALWRPAPDERSDQHLEAFEKAYGEYQSLAKVGDFHAALPKAQISVELGELIFGDDHSNTAALSWI